MLRTIKLGEADRIVTFMTLGHGKVRAVAKGIRKTTSKFGARLEPTSRVAFQCYRGRELDIVTQVETMEANRHLREEYALLTHAIPMLEAVDQVAQEREPNPALYRMLTGALRTLGERHNPVVTPAFFWKLLSLEGVHPMLDGCARCGLGDDDTELTAFDLDEGGALCRPVCPRRGPGAQPRSARAVAAHARRRPERRARRSDDARVARGRAPRHPGARASRRAAAALHGAPLSRPIKPKTGGPDR